MQHQSVVSSNISSIGYDTASATLEITFKNGRTYRYAGVPAGVHAQLLSAPSHGKYFNAHVKDRFVTQQIG